MADATATTIARPVKPAYKGRLQPHKARCVRARVGAVRRVRPRAHAPVHTRTAPRLRRGPGRLNVPGPGRYETLKSIGKQPTSARRTDPSYSVPKSPREAYTKQVRRPCPRAVGASREEGAARGSPTPRRARAPAPAVHHGAALHAHAVDGHGEGGLHRARRDGEDGGIEAAHVPVLLHLSRAARPVPEVVRVQGGAGEDRLVDDEERGLHAAGEDDIAREAVRLAAFDEPDSAVRQVAARAVRETVCVQGGGACPPRAGAGRAGGGGYC